MIRDRRRNLLRHRFRESVGQSAENSPRADWPRFSIDCFHANFLPADAVSNYLAFKCRLFQKWGIPFSITLSQPAKRQEFSDRVMLDSGPHSGDVEIFEYAGYYPLLEQLHQPSRAIRIFDFHGVTPTQLWVDDSLSWSEKQIALAQNADFVFVHSQFLRRELMERYRVKSEQIFCFPYCVDLKVLDPAPTNSYLDKAFGTEGKRMLLYLGRLAPNKRVDILIEGLRFLPQDVCLLLVGNQSSPPYGGEADRMRRLAKDLGLNDRVIFVGTVSKGLLARLLQAAEILVSASLHEGFGIPFIEAMASGTPSVGCHSTAIPEVLEKAGLTFRPCDARHFADQASRLLEDDTLYLQCVEDGFRQVSRYSIGTLQDNLSMAFNRILTGLATK